MKVLFFRVMATRDCNLPSVRMRDNPMVGMYQEVLRRLDQTDIELATLKAQVPTMV